MGWVVGIDSPIPWMETNIPEGLTVLDANLGLSAVARRRLRTTNALERVNKGDQATHERRNAVSERGVDSAAGERPADGDQR